MPRRHNQRFFWPGTRPHLGQDRICPHTCNRRIKARRKGAGRANELRVHIKGALTNGCTAEQLQEILLLVALYCGIPAANEAHRIAVDVLGEA